MSRYATRIAAVGAVGILLAGCEATSGNEAAATLNEAGPAVSTIAEPANAAAPAGNGASAQAAPAEASEPPVKVGERFEIALPQSAGTGYSWALKSPPSATVELLGQSVETPPPEGSAPMAGGAQVALFRFRAAAPGEADLVFVQQRAWAPKPDDRTETRKITVIP
ncbi:MAG TPA: protease inhibitor I42 family protein [Allosphingosinicella sp.]